MLPRSKETGGGINKNRRGEDKDHREEVNGKKRGRIEKMGRLMNV